MKEIKSGLKTSKENKVKKLPIFTKFASPNFPQPKFRRNIVLKENKAMTDQTPTEKKLREEIVDLLTGRHGMGIESADADATDLIAFITDREFIAELAKENGYEKPAKDQKPPEHHVSGLSWAPDD